MEDIPQPSPEPYSVGDQVRIYVGPNDTDSRYHGIVCEISDIFTDALDSETGRRLDAYSYTLQRSDSGEELPITFRHHDLIPAHCDQ